MRGINISEANISSIIQINETAEEKDVAFLNALWKYVLFSKNVSRTLPSCTICNKQEEFVYEGFGGIKKVGNGMMYIPINSKVIYLVPDIVFHYFYSHDKVPTSVFRDAVINGYKPNTNEYKEIIGEVYCNTDDFSNIWQHIKCSYCGEVFEGTIAFRISRREDDVRIFREKFYSKLLHGEKYVGVCKKCLHYTKI